MELEFFIFWLLATLPIGVNVILVINTSVNVGWPRASMVPCGILTGALVWLFISINISEAILKDYIGLVNKISFVGGVYIIYLSVSIYLRRNIFTKKNETNVALKNALKDLLKQDSYARIYLMGMFSALSNPKALVLYVTILPTYMYAEENPISILNIAILTSSVSIIVNFGYSILAHYLGKYILRNKKYQMILNNLSALSLLVLGSFVIYNSIT